MEIPRSHGPVGIYVQGPFSKSSAMGSFTLRRICRPNPRTRQSRSGCTRRASWAAVAGSLGRLNDYRSDNINSIKENTDEIYDQLVRASARIAYGIRKCPEADTGGFHSMESARQFQDRGVRCASGRVGRAYAGGLR